MAGFSGRCFCGGVRYESAAAPEFAYYCHCTDCRRVNGTAFHTGLVVPRTAFRVTAGAAAKHDATADSGHTISRFFCPACGAQLWSQTTADERILSVKAGSVDGDLAIDPTIEIWMQSRVAWADIPTGLTRYLRGARGEEPISP